MSDVDYGGGYACVREQGVYGKLVYLFLNITVNLELKQSSLFKMRNDEENLNTTLIFYDIKE